LTKQSSMALYYPMRMLMLRLPAFLLSWCFAVERTKAGQLPDPEKKSPGHDDQHKSDDALVGRIALRDHTALSELYDRFSGTLMAVSMRILNDRAAAEDVVQDVFLHIWNKAETFNAANGKAISWSVVITRNKAIDKVRARMRTSKMVERATLENDETPVRPTGLGDTDRTEHLQGALADLVEDQRVAIELAFFGGLSQAEIADQLGKPLGTVKAHIRRGMLKLRDKLQPMLQ
jgi:RNA polymerase sigma-70 factor, ECF subfamily